MGCFCAGNSVQESADFHFILLKLKLISIDKPYEFTIIKIAEDLFHKENGKTFFSIIESSSNINIVSAIKNNKIKKCSLFYSYLRDKPVIKNYKSMKDYKPYNFRQLHKVVALLTNEGNLNGVSNIIIKKRIYDIDEFINKNIDFNEEMQKQQEVNNQELTDDSFELSLYDNENLQSDNNKERNNSNNVLVINNIIDENTFRYIKETLCNENKKFASGNETKEEISNGTIGINLKVSKKTDNFEIEEMKEDEILDKNNKDELIIKTFIIQNVKIQDSEIFTRLIDLFKTNQNLKSFVFSNIQIDSNFIGWDDIFDLIESNSHIRSISLSNCRIYDKNIKELTKSLKEKRLRSLSIKENFVSYQGAEILSKWLKKNKTLQKLDLQRNTVTQFKAAGVKHITDSLLFHPNIQIIDLSFMELTTCGESLAELINKSKTLHTLFLHCTKLNYGDFKSICRATAKSEYLLSLDIGMNYMGGKKSLEEIANMLKETEKLEDINLDQIGLDMENYLIIFDGFRENVSVKKVHISYNIDMKIKVMVNFFKERENIKWLEYVPYNSEINPDKKITNDEKRILERVKKERPDMTFIYE